MRNIQDPSGGSEARQVTFPQGAVVVADQAYLEKLEQLDVAMSLRLVPLEIDSALPAQVVDEASIVVLHADSKHRGSMRRITALRTARPFMPLIVALEDADLNTTRALIHEGVNDVVALPFDHDQLVNSLIDASVGAENEPVRGEPPGTLYSVIGSHGGCGATTVATHLADELARQTGQSCCFLDLDVQFGTASNYLGVASSLSVHSLLEAGSRLDADLFNSVALSTNAEMSLVAAPPSILPLEEIDVDQILRVLRHARQNADMVMLDLPLDFTNWSVSSILQSDVIVLVVEMNLTSLRHARRRIDLLADMGIDRKIVRAVTNRVEKKFFKTIDNSDVENALKVPVCGSISKDTSVLHLAQDQGLLAHQYQTKNKFSKDIAALAEALSQVGVHT